MAEDTYNGWTNYPTWDVYTWLSSDEATNAHMEAIAQLSPNVTSLADAIRDYIQVDNPYADGVSLFADLLSWSLSLVNWQEVADAYWECTHELTTGRNEPNGNL